MQSRAKIVVKQAGFTRQTQGLVTQELGFKHSEVHWYKMKIKVGNYSEYKRPYIQRES